MSEQVQSEGMENQGSQITESNLPSGETTTPESPASSEPNYAVSSSEPTPTQTEPSNSGELPEYAKQRIGQQKKHYEKRIKQLESQFREKEAQWSQPPQQQWAPQEAPVSYEAPQNSDAPTSVRAEVFAALEEQKKMEADKVQQTHWEQQEAYKAQKVNEFQDRLNEASGRYDDYDEVVRNPDLPVSQAMVEAAMFMPNGPDLLYHLGKNPTEVSRLSHLHPFEQAREMVKMGMSIGNKPVVSQAPPPVAPLTGGSQPNVSRIQDMTYSQMKQGLRAKRTKR